MLRGLTGEGFSARYLADECNASVGRGLRAGRVDDARPRPRASTRTPSPASLDAHIRVVHGHEVLADSSDGEEAMCERFESWVRAHYGTPGT